jgi:hypothetical protein
VLDGLLGRSTPGEHDGGGGEDENAHCHESPRRARGGQSGSRPGV